MRVTTVGGPINVTKIYQIFIQVSCLSLTPPSTSEFTCATGSSSITLPANGGSGTLVVPISPPIDPELIEVHDLSFIVTGTQTTGCTPSITLTASPTTVNVVRSTAGLVNATVTKTVTSICGFTGLVKFGPPPVPAGVTISFFPNPITVPPNGSASTTEIISVSPSTLPGTYSIPNTAIGPPSATVTVTLNVA